MDRINTISPQYIYQNSTGYSMRINREDALAQGDKNDKEKQQNALSAAVKGTGLTSAQLSVVEKLKSRDQQVRSHEMAHVSAGGQYVTSGINFSYQKGPDGVMYAIGGEVGIDLSPVSNNPQATISKMQVVRSAALAPSDPSPQDRRVAAAASEAISTAQYQIIENQTKETEDKKASDIRVNGASLYEDDASSKGEKIDISA